MRRATESLVFSARSVRFSHRPFFSLVVTPWQVYLGQLVSQNTAGRAGSVSHSDIGSAYAAMLVFSCRMVAVEADSGMAEPRAVAAAGELRIGRLVQPSPTATAASRRRSENSEWVRHRLVPPG
jgi:hypothetical protein